MEEDLYLYPPQPLLNLVISCKWVHLVCPLAFRQRSIVGRGWVLSEQLRCKIQLGNQHQVIQWQNWLELTKEWNSTSLSKRIHRSRSRKYLHKPLGTSKSGHLHTRKLCQLLGYRGWDCIYTTTKPNWLSIGPPKAPNILFWTRIYLKVMPKLL